MNQNNEDVSRPEKDYYLNEDLCDVVFIVEDQRIPAPKQLLSVKSRVFRAMFSGNFIESEDKVIPIEDTTYEAFNTLIRFILCDELVFSDDNDLDLMAHVLRLSDKYEVFRLSKKVMDRIKSRLYFANLRSITRIAFNYNMEPLIDSVIEFIGNNIIKIIRQNSGELSAINECSNNRLFDLVISGRYTDRLIVFTVEDRLLFVTKTFINKHHYSTNHLNDVSTEWQIKESFEAFKVLIGFLYFNRLIIKDKNDFKLIRQICLIAEKYSIKEILDEISADLQNSITLENHKPILKIIFDFKIKNLTQNIFEFIQTNIEELVERDVEEWSDNSHVMIHVLYVMQKYGDSVIFKERLTALLMNYIETDTMVNIHYFAEEYDMSDLKSNVFTFVENNIKEICREYDDIESLVEINEGMYDIIFKVMAKHFINN